MKVFDIGELRKTARLKDNDPSRSYSDIHKSSVKGSVHENFNSFQSSYLSRWGRDIEGKNDRQVPWINVGQGIFTVAVGQEHVLILNNKHECFTYGSNSYGQLAQQNSAVSKPTQIGVFKEMKITGIYAGAYHSFIQNSKGEVYGFGLNMKGQLGAGHYENQKKPTLIHSLLPHGSKNPRSSFFLETSEYRRKSKRSRDDHSELSTITNLFEKYDLHEEEKMPNFLLVEGELIIKIACGPLHTAALSNKNRLFCCGFGEKYNLGNGKAKTICQFIEVEVKGNHKIDRLQAGVSSLGYVAGGKAYITGKFGQKIYQNFTSLPISQEIIDLKIGQNSAIFLSKKGELYQMGLIYKDNYETSMIEIPRKIQKMTNIKQIFSGVNSFFAISDNKVLFGWGQNDFNQVSGVSDENFLPQPKILTIPIYCNGNNQIISGNGTTFYLSSKPLQTDYSKCMKKSDETPKKSQRALHKRGTSTSKSALSNICGTEEQNMLNQLGVQPRMFNCNMEIDFNQLVFESQISEGGYGIIYKGLWRETVVAIKMFKIQSQGAVKDFFSECGAMEALRHPNIVMFLGACTKPPNFAIVLEYCTRGSLWSTIQNLDIPLTWDDRRRFALDTARGVNYLHTCSPPIIHRDLKSLNLLLDDSYRVKLADFGWTKGLENYMTGKIGTYQWMAPEVIASQNYSEKADVFSYGIILWQIASRQPPFKHLTGLQVSIKVLNNDLRPTIPKKTPEHFSKLMQKCWDREPSKRPSFKQIIKELQCMKF